MKKITFEEAKRLSIKKWTLFVENDGYCSLRYDDELNQLNSYCGFCERYNYDCTKCEFGQIAGICKEDDSLHNKWGELRDVENAKKILNIITNLNESKQ